MRLLSIILIFGGITSCSEKAARGSEPTIEADTLSRYYTEVIKENGVPVHMNFYSDKVLKARVYFSNGYVIDHVRFDSLGNVTSYDPILILLNTKAFKTDDTLVFKIKNVDPLTYYQYVYSTSKIAFELEGTDGLKRQKPINSKLKPFIKIARKDINEERHLYFLWGYLASSRDSSDFRIDEWNYLDENFEFDWWSKNYAQQG